MTAQRAVPDDAIKSKCKRRERKAAVAARAVTIGEPPQAICDFRREVSNLPRVMETVERVEGVGGGRGRWVVKGPADRTFEWDARITEDEPGRRIAWTSEDSAQGRNDDQDEWTKVVLRPN